MFWPLSFANATGQNRGANQTFSVRDFSFFKGISVFDVRGFAGINFHEQDLKEFGELFSFLMRILTVFFFVFSINILQVTLR